KFFQAVVSFVGTDGTIYIIPKSFESEMNRLMDEIKRNFQYLDPLESYCWKEGEACLVRVSDNKWLRGKVVKLGDSAFEVQFIDRGCTERIPPCDLYPTTLYADIHPFCIPCQLYKTVPIGNVWQKEAVCYLQEILLTDKEVDIQVQDLPDKPWGKLSISLYFGGISLASFMAHQKYCIAEDSEDRRQLEILEGYDIVWLTYELPPLPVPGDIFPVKVTHLVSPNEVYIFLDPCKLHQKPLATEGGASSDTQWESLDEALKWCTENMDSIPLTTEFQTEMPCLAQYSDGLWYRAKLLSILKSDPVEILLQFVDFGSFSVVSPSR
ncbi:RNF17 protein, partial [Geococcyx californianus]|nr:RNF17 protein [Geococcyx californianus]